MGLLFFYIFVYLYYPMKFERKFLKGPPPLAPPCFEKSGPPLLTKKLDPLPWAFGACARMDLATFTGYAVGLAKYFLV